MSYDPEQDAWAQMEERAQQDFNMSPQQFYDTVNLHYQVAVANAWGLGHQELSGAHEQQNVQQITGILKEHGWEITPGNLDAALAIARERGLVRENTEQAQQSFDEFARTATPEQLRNAIEGQHQPDTRSDFDKWAETATAEQIREYAEKKYGAR